MGANAQTSVPVFTAGQVLTAAQQTEINTGIPVFATTVTRDAAFGGTGEKTLAEGQFAYIEATNTTQYYDGAAWQAVGASGLTLVSATTIGSAVSSVTVSSAFSATYDNYKVVVSGGVCSAAPNIALQLGSTTTDYYAGYNKVTISTNSSSPNSDNNTSSFTRAGLGDTNNIYCALEIFNPFLSKRTFFSGIYIDPNMPAGSLGSATGLQNSNTSFTAFTLTPSTGTLTGGTIRVYGYANS